MDRHVLALPVDLVGPVAEHPVEGLHRDGHQVGVGDPRPVEALRRLAVLVLAHLLEGDRVHLRVAAGGDERRHAAHRVRVAAVAGLHQQLAVGAHERHRHRHRGTIGKDELGPMPELLDHAEDVVPAPRVEACRVLAQLVEDLVHLERGEDRLDQDGRLDRPARHAEPVLRPLEHVVPETRLEMRLQLGEVEVPPVPGVVAEEVEAEVEQRAGHRRTVDLEVALLEVPPPRADEEHGDLVVQRVALLAGIELDGSLEGVGQVPLSLDAVLPGRRVRVLEVRHEDLGARVERVDHHLPVDGAGDLDAAVGDLVRERRDPPVAAPDPGRLRQEVGQLAHSEPAAREASQALAAAREQLAPALTELPLEVGEEPDRVGSQDVVGAHEGYLARLTRDASQSCS